jgi:5-hydroxyisourate hydrolase-like protein (transthyretin family)
MSPIEQLITTHSSATETIYGTEFTFTGAPTRPIEGIVVDAQTRQPLAGVRVESYKLADYPFSAHSVLKTTTDAAGRFRLVGMPKAAGNILMLVPNDEQPYLMRRVPVPDPTGIDPVRMTIELHRGIWITGRITDKSTGEPVPGVRMHYLPFRTNEFAQALPEFDKDGNTDGDQRRYQTKADGTYRLVGLPGRAVVGAESIYKSYRYGVGYEAIDAPKEGKSDWLLTYRNPINPGPKWPSAMREINPDKSVEEVKLDIELDPGASVRIRMVDAQDKPVTGADCDGLSPRHYQPKVDESVLTATNFGPQETRSIVIHHKGRNIGRVIQAGPAEVAQGEIQVKLLPCATVTGRLMNQGEPLSGLSIEPRVLPSGDFSKRLPTIATDSEGRFTCTLVPGSQYNLHAEGKGLDFYATVANDLTIEPGETKDVGTLTLAKGRKFVAMDAVPNAAQDEQQTPDKSTTSPPVEATTTSLRGSITDPNGKPAIGAFVAVIAANVQPQKQAKDPRPWCETLGETTTDETGRFELRWSGVTSKTHANASVIARSIDSGLVYQRLDLDAAESQVEFKLQPQQLIQGRLVDIEGQPAAGLAIELSAVIVPKQMNEGVGIPKMPQPPRAWPPRVMTDERGQFTIRNVAAGQGVYLNIEGNDRFAPQDLALNTGWSEQRGERDGTYRSHVKNIKPGEVATIPIAPAQIFEGVVLLGDSGKPAANARITIWASQQEFAGSMVSIEGMTDAAGRFRLNPRPGVRFGIIAYPPQGSPYQVRRLNDLRWSSGKGSQEIEIKLGIGVLVQGVVVDANTSKPLQNASVQYHPDRVNNTNVTDDIVTGWQNIQKTDSAGRFNISVFPGPGTLLVHSEEGSYILKEMGSSEVEQGKSGGPRMYAHAFHKINPQAGDVQEAIQVALTPGATVEGTITDGRGNSIQQALVVSRLKISPLSPQWRGFPDEALNGKFKLSGLREGEEYPVYFLDPKNRLGATALISTKDLSPKIVLVPCGSARARFVDAAGKPVPSGTSLGLHMVVTPGKPKYDLQAMRRGELLADEDFVANVDRRNSEDSSTTNEKGEMTFPVLIPGASYRFINFIKGEARASQEFVAQSGQTHDMGDIEVQIEP